MSEQEDQLMSELLDVLNDNWPATVGPAENLDASLMDMGFDSLDMSSLVLAVEEYYSITIEDDEIETLKSINDIAALLRTKRS